MRNLRRNLVLTTVLGIAIMIGLSGSANATPILTFGSNSTDTGNTSSSTTTTTNDTDSSATLNTTTSSSNSTTSSSNSTTSSSNSTGGVTLSSSNSTSNRVAVNNVDASKDLPQTGENDIYIVTAVGAVALIIGGVAYMKSRKYDM